MPTPLNLDPALRSHLNNTAQALYNLDEPAAQRYMSQVSALSPQTERMIYRKLWELAGRPTHESHPEIAHRHYGRLAFGNQEGRTAPIQQKIQAIETVLSNLVHNARESLIEPQGLPPAGAEQVKYDVFFDCGFDPRFSEDGKFYLNTPSRPLSELITTIREVIATLLFKLNAYLNFDGDERNVRQLILSCTKLEKAFSDYTYDAHMISYPAVQCVPEHAFFERVSDLFKAIFPDEAHPPRLFPSELLHSIHAINKPQPSLLCPAELASPYDVLDDGNLSRWDNGDLDRSSHWGLFRLTKGNFSYPTPEGWQKLDRFEHNYVPHYLMVHAIQESSADLKTACRVLRTTLSEITIDMDSASSLEQCKQKISPQLQRVKQCWDLYTQSHELLTEVQSVFSQKDHHAPAYKALDSQENSFFPNWVRSLFGFGDDLTAANSSSMQSVMEAYTGPFRDTLTGRLLAITEPHNLAARERHRQARESA